MAKWINCSVRNCLRRATSNRMCDAHNKRDKRWGDPRPDQLIKHPKIKIKTR
jgi:hypothetical protein